MNAAQRDILVMQVLRELLRDRPVYSAGAALREALTAAIEELSEEENGTA